MNTQEVKKIPDGRHQITGFDLPIDHQVTIHTTAGDLLVKGDDVKKRRVFIGVTDDPPFVERPPKGRRLIVGMPNGTATCIKYSLGIPLE